MLLSTSTGYAAMQNAYNKAGDGETLLSQVSILNENLSIDKNKTVNLEGGYDCSYVAFFGDTTINGNVSITNGSLIINDGIFTVGNLE